MEFKDLIKYVEENKEKHYRAITRNKFANMSKKDWQEANEVTKETRGSAN